MPDAATHAYRRDLADVALAGRVIASHYAEPLPRRLSIGTPLCDGPGGEVLLSLVPGDTFRMLDCTGGWAWGYGPQDRVGYVRSDALTV